MPERMIQVPESLIERVQLAIREGLYPDAPEWADLDHQLALLSPPNPTAELPKPLNPEAVQRVLNYHGWPPRIEDMAPGTTFWGKFIPGGELRQFERSTGSYPIRSLPSRTGYRANDVVPSTIRDVTPPKGDDRD